MLSRLFVGSEFTSLFSVQVEFQLLVLGLYFADQLPVKEGHKIVCSDLDRYTFQILHQ